MRKPQRFKDLPISLKISSTKRVWHNVVGVIKTAGVRILKIFVRILQTKLTPLNPFHLNKNESREMLGIMPPQASPRKQSRGKLVKNQRVNFLGFAHRFC